MDINISEAKAQLSKLINLAYHGEKIVICKNNFPLVDLVRHKPEGKRKLGLLRLQVSLRQIMKSKRCFMAMTHEVTAGHPYLFVGAL